MSGRGLEDSEDLCDPDDPRYLWPRYDLEVSEFPPRLSDFEGLDRAAVILRRITGQIGGSVCEALYRAYESCVLVQRSSIIPGLQAVY